MVVLVLLLTTHLGCCACVPAILNENWKEECARHHADDATAARRLAKEGEARRRKAEKLKAKALKKGKRAAGGVAATGAKKEEKDDETEEDSLLRPPGNLERALIRTHWWCVPAHATHARFTIGPPVQVLCSPVANASARQAARLGYSLLHPRHCTVCTGTA